MGNKMQLNQIAPQFELADFNGRVVRLSDYRGHKHVVLVFNRGFA
jgi:peroxiredoxin